VEYVAFVESFPTHPLEIWNAARDGKVDLLASLLERNRNFDVNWQYHDEDAQTMLHQASGSGYSSVVHLLLRHPLLAVNKRDRSGRTAFHLACLNGRVKVAQMLLAAPSFDPSATLDSRGNTALRDAASWGHLDVIRAWMASGREIDLGDPGNVKTDAIGEAAKANRAKVVALLRRFKENPRQTANEARRDLGLEGKQVWPFEGLLLQGDSLSPLRSLSLFSVFLRWSDSAP